MMQGIAYLAVFMYMLVNMAFMTLHDVTLFQDNVHLPGCVRGLCAGGHGPA